MERFPCGKCAACLLSNANSWMFRLSDEINNHPFALWFTLTYSNEFVPKLKPIFRDWIGRWFYCSDHSVNLRHDSFKVVLRKDGIAIDSFKLKDFPLQNYEFSDCIGYLSKRDIQLFLKILRKKIYERFQVFNSVRYFICGEYGPKTFRPHYHCLLFIDNPEILSFVIETIPSCWPMCNREFITQFMRLADGKTSGYVTSYVNSISSLPAFYKEDAIKPFHLQSKNPAIGFGSFCSNDLYSAIYDGNLFYHKQVERAALEYLFPYPVAFLGRFLPKCFEYRQKSFSQLLFVYGLLCRALKQERFYHLSYSVGLSSNGYITETTLEETKKDLRKELKVADYNAALRCYNSGLSPLEFVFLVERCWYLYDMQLLRYWYTWQEEQSLAGNMFDILRSYSNVVRVIQKYSSFSLYQRNVVDLFMLNFKIKKPYAYDKILEILSISSTFEPYKVECEFALSQLDKSKKLNKQLNPNLIEL